MAAGATEAASAPKLHGLGAPVSSCICTSTILRPGPQKADQAAGQCKVRAAYRPLRCGKAGASLAQLPAAVARFWQNTASGSRLCALIAAISPGSDDQRLLSSVRKQFRHPQCGVQENVANLRLQHFFLCACIEGSICALLLLSLCGSPSPLLRAARLACRELCVSYRRSTSREKHCSGSCWQPLPLLPACGLGPALPPSLLTPRSHGGPAAHLRHRARAPQPGGV